MYFNLLGGLGCFKLTDSVWFGVFHFTGWCAVSLWTKLFGGISMDWKTWGCFIGLKCFGRFILLRRFIV